MAITRSKSQQHETLTEFYTEAAESDHSTTSSLGYEMLKWIDRLNSELPNLKIWGLTSHYRLVLMANETFDGDWSVIISGFKHNYRIEYLIPEKGSPWRNAYVTGETNNFEEAIKMTIIGIEKSGAWKKNIV